MNDRPKKVYRSTESNIDELEKGEGYEQKRERGSVADERRDRNSGNNEDSRMYSRGGQVGVRQNDQRTSAAGQQTEFEAAKEEIASTTETIT